MREEYRERVSIRGVREKNTEGGDFSEEDSWSLGCYGEEA